MTNLELIILHAGPHNLVEWLLYGLLLLAMIAIGVGVVRGDSMNEPWDDATGRRVEDPPHKLDRE